jgi:AcrR family transcriptional regulator
LYQYFPNKSALLQAVLKRHMDEVAVAVERACGEQRGQAIEQMGAALITAFLEAKMKDPKASVALYSISSDLDAAGILQETHRRINVAMLAMFKTAPELNGTDLEVVCEVLQGAMAGVSRKLVEEPGPERRQQSLRCELIRMFSGYLRSCCEAKDS